MFPLEFCTEVNNEETRAMGLSSTEDRIIEAGDDQSISRVLTWYRIVMDGQKDGFSIARKPVC